MAVEQHSYEVASGKDPLRLDSSIPPCSASLCPTLPVLDQQDIFSVSASAGEMPSSVEREIVLPEPRGTDLYSEESLLPVPDWSVLMQMRTPHYFSFMVHEAVS